MKAVVLAAGEGTRLEPLTNVRPKPMLPVANKPILEHVVEAVAAAGIDEVVLVVGYKRQRIQDHFGDGDDWGVDVSYVAQQPQLGSGDALLQAEPLVGGEFVVLNGDQIVDASAIDAVVAARERTGDPVLAATRSAETELYGVVQVEDGTVVELAEKPPATTVESDLVNAGVYAFGPEVFSAIRATDAEGELGLTAVLDQHLRDHPVQVVTYDGPWFDVTRPWDLLTVNSYLLDRVDAGASANVSVHDTATVVEGALPADGVAVQPNATVLRGVALGENVSVGANAVVENAVVMRDVTVGAGCVLRDCVVGANVDVGPGTVAEGGETDVVVGDAVHRGVQFGGVLGDNASLGGTVTVGAGTRLGNDSEVQAGAVLDGWFDAGSNVRRG